MKEILTACALASVMYFASKRMKHIEKKLNKKIDDKFDDLIGMGKSETK